MMELLPAPVLPTMPTFSPSLIWKEIFLRTNGSPSLYLMEKLSNRIVAFSFKGHL